MTNFKKSVLTQSAVSPVLHIDFKGNRAGYIEKSFDAARLGRVYKVHFYENDEDVIVAPRHASRFKSLSAAKSTLTSFIACEF